MEGAHNKTYRRQVPETDPEYQQLQEGWRQILTPQIFGAYDVLHFEQCTETYELYTKLAAVADQRLQQPELSELMRTVLLEEKAKNEQQAAAAIEDRDIYLRNSFMQLAVQVRMHALSSVSQERKDYIITELTRLLGDTDVQQMVAEDLGFLKLDTITVEMLTSEEVSAEVLYVVAARHVERLKAQQQELTVLVAEVKTEFVDKITKAVASGLLPEDAQSAVSRIERLSVLLVDRLIQVDSMLFGGHSQLGAVLVSNELLSEKNREKLIRTLYHEFLHELSGKSITIETEVDENNEIKSDISHRKSGVALHIDPKRYDPNRWLNEAITEWLALDLSGYHGDSDENSYKGSNFYSIERASLDRLFGLGLDPDLVKRAYFENFTNDQDMQQKGRYFRELIQAVNSLEGGFGFTKIENQHILLEIARNLLRDYNCVLFTKDEPLPDWVDEDGVAVFKINLKVGINPEARVEEQFLYACSPIQSGDKLVTVEDQLGRVKNFLLNNARLYSGDSSRVTYSVEVLEVPAV